jgi:hypothetical protein
MSPAATVEDIHASARGMRHVTVFRPESNPVHQVETWLREHRLTN